MGEGLTMDAAVIDRALTVMAVCLVIQTLVLIGGSVAIYMAWRRGQAALDQQVREVRAQLDRVSLTVEQASAALQLGTLAVGNAVADARHTIGSVAALVTGPRTALALGAWRGLQWWQRMRENRRAAPARARL